MLYEDKFGTYWEDEEVDRLTGEKIKELGLHASYLNDDDLFD